MSTPSHAPQRSAPVQAVRAATQTRHRRTEQRLDVRGSFASVDDYGAMLARLLGFHAPLEDALRGSAPAVAGVEPLPRTARLEDDLRAVGVNPAAVRHCPSPLDLPTNDAGRVGALYVIEGSALGGAVLARLAQRRLGLTADRGASFFHGDTGPATDARWALVLGAIDAQAAADRLPAVIAGAQQTFDAFDAWLSETA